MLSAVDIGLVSLRATPFYEAVLPGKLMDVMAAGIPVLSWVDGQTGVLLNESGGGLVAAGGDVNGLLDGLEELCAAGEEGRRAMGESGRRWASAHLDGQVLAEQWAEGLAASLTGAQGGGVMRFLLSAVRGARAALGGRSSRILGPLMGPGAGGKPAVAMRRWLEQRRSIESGPARS